MRHGIGTLAPKSFTKIELLQEEVLALTNEFFVTFFAEDKLFEKKFIFPPSHSVTENSLMTIPPIVEKEGVLAQD